MVSIGSPLYFYVCLQAAKSSEPVSALGVFLVASSPFLEEGVLASLGTLPASCLPTSLPALPQSLTPEMVVKPKVPSLPLPLLSIFLFPRSRPLPVYGLLTFQSRSSVLDSRPICPAAHEMPLLSIPPGRTQHVQTRTRSISQTCFSFSIPSFGF